VSGGSIGIVDALVGLGLCASKGEARRKIAEGAIKIDDQPVSDPAANVSVTGQVKISFGKKKHGLLVPA
jgi:tyrosyl-tRNA synthetase